MAPHFSRQVESMPTLQLGDVNLPHLEVSEIGLIYSAGVTLSAKPQERSAESSRYPYEYLFHSPR